MLRFISKIALLAPLAACAPTPEPSAPVAAPQVARLFAGNTWIWGDGGAYFAPDGSFRAVTGARQFAEGTWSAPGGGRVCFDAEWTAGEVAAPARACFVHRVDGQGRLWQGRQGSAEPFAAFDPRTALRRGDVLGAAFDRAMAPREGVPSRLLDAREVAALFAGRTWVWGEGAGAFFAPDGRFRAVSGPREIAVGRWTAEAGGAVCADAVWQGPGYAPAQRRTCWIHARDGRGRIWQRPDTDPDAWTVLDRSAGLARGEVNLRAFARAARALGR